MKKRIEQLEEFRKLDEADLRVKVGEFERELLNLRFKHSSGQLEQAHQLGIVRKQIARVKSVLAEKANQQESNS